MSAPLNSAERLVKVETMISNLLEQQKRNEESQESTREELLEQIQILHQKFDKYVRLERFKIVEVAVYGVIGLMTTSVIIALLALVIKGGGS